MFCEVSQVHISVSTQLSVLIVILHVVNICVGTSVTDILSCLPVTLVDCVALCSVFGYVCTCLKYSKHHVFGAAPNGYKCMYVLWQVL